MTIDWKTEWKALAAIAGETALSLRSMLVHRTIMGTRKTAVYFTLVVGMATMTGMIYGALFQSPTHQRKERTCN